ncbi:MAG: hypothetical protein U1G07_00860 [Verrucomicrobiota bacterium]
MKTPSRPVARPRLGRAARAGYMLVECLLYIGLLALVMGVAFSAFYRCLADSRSLARNTEDIINVLRAGEMWRADLRQAQTEPEWMARAGVKACEIRQTNGLIAYILADGAIWRREGQDAPVQLVPRVREFKVSKEQQSYVTSWRCDIELQTRSKGARVRPLFSFQAVPGRGSP